MRQLLSCVIPSAPVMASVLNGKLSNVHFDVMGKENP